LEIAPPLTEKSASVEAVAEEDGRTEENGRKIKAGRRESEEDFLHVHTASLPTVSERR
jgi:hypothetical protein